MNIFNLKADVTLDTSKYKKGLKDAEKQSETSAKKIDDNFKQTSEVTAAQLSLIQSQYNSLVKSSGSVLADLNNLVKNGLIKQSQYSQEYTKALEEFKKQEQEIIDRAKEMGIAFENGKFKIVDSATKSEISWKSVGAVVKEIVKILKKLVTETIEYSNEIYEVAKQFDMTTESVSGLQYIASQTGTTLSTVTNAMTQLERKAASGNSVFEELGVSITDANGNYKSMETVLFDTIGALNELNDESEKSAYMSQLFGRTTMENGELFRLTADEIANLRQESEDLGITMSENTAKFGADITRQIEALKLQGQSALSAILAGEDDGEEKLQAFFDNVVIVAEKYLPKFLSFGIRLITYFGTSLLRYVPQLVAEVVGILIDTIFEIDWFKVGIDIAKSVLEGFLNIAVSVLNSLFGWAGVNIPKIDMNVGQSVFYDNANSQQDYELNQRVEQDITVKVEASGDTAISKESAEETAKALVPYIDQILGAK